MANFLERAVPGSRSELDSATAMACMARAPPSTTPSMMFADVMAPMTPFPVLWD